MAFAIQAEAMDEKEFKAFVRELPIDPTGGKSNRSHGVSDLVRMMGGARRPKPPAMPTQPPKTQEPAPEKAAEGE